MLKGQADSDIARSIIVDRKGIYEKNQERFPSRTEGFTTQKKKREKNVARALTLLVLVATADNQYGRSAPRFEEEKVVGSLRRYAPPRPLQPRIFN